VKVFDHLAGHCKEPLPPGVCLPFTGQKLPCQLPAAIAHYAQKRDEEWEEKEKNSPVCFLRQVNIMEAKNRLENVKDRGEGRSSGGVSSPPVKFAFSLRAI